LLETEKIITVSHFIMGHPVIRSLTAREESSHSHIMESWRMGQTQ